MPDKDTQLKLTEESFGFGVGRLKFWSFPYLVGHLPKTQALFANLFLAKLVQRAVPTEGRNLGQTTNLPLA